MARTYIFKGLVLPERTSLTLGPIGMRFEYPFDQTQHVAEINVVLNQVTVLVQSDRDWSIHDLRNVVAQLTTNLVSIIGYVHGHGYDVEIRQVLDPENDIDFVFGIDIPVLVERNKDIDHKARFDQIMRKTQGAPGRYISRALHDLLEAMKNPQDAAFHCFRALETLKQLCGYQYQIEGDRNQWNRLSEITGFGEEDVQELRRRAFGARHGLPEPISDEERARLYNLTWDIVDAFFDHYQPKSGWRGD